MCVADMLAHVRDEHVQPHAVRPDNLWRLHVRDERSRLDEIPLLELFRAATADRRRNDGPKLRENFYRFQQREKRRGELYELKMRFEADKDRVAKLKASRKFRPT